MGCIYEFDRNTPFGACDVLQDSEAGIRIRVQRKGAEPVSLSLMNRAGNPVGFLYRDDDPCPPVSGWANHATLMGYYIHRLVNQRSAYRGHVIQGGNHGFLRGFEFDAPTFVPSENAIRYRVPADGIPSGAYPLRVSMTLDYRLEGTRLRVQFRFQNEEPEAVAHVSFGQHPGFAVSSVEGAEVLLPPGSYVRHFAPGNFLDGRTEKIQLDGGPMRFSKAALPDSFILGLAQVPNPIIRIEDRDRGTGVELDFCEAPYFTLWSDLSPFICIEPCWGLPDSIPQKPFEQKDGIQSIEPGEVLSAGYGIRPFFIES